MKVAFDAGPITAHRTGIGHYAHQLATHLLARPEDCHLRLWSVGRLPVDYASLDGATDVRRIPVPARVVYAAWHYTRRPYLETLVGDADLVHATNYFLPPTRRARRVLTIHDLAFAAVPEVCPIERVGPFAGDLGRFAREADAVIAVSEATKRDVIRYFEVPPENIAVVHHGKGEQFRFIERDEAQAWLRTEYGIDAPFFLFVSTIEPRKNVATLVRAFAKAARDLPHSLVLIGGEGRGAREVFALADQLGVGARIVRPGYVDAGELPWFYSGAEAFVFPSDYEGFGMPVLEAMACGCPVICADNSSLPEVAGGAADLVQATDVDGLAAAMVKVATDAEHREALRTRGLARADEFSWARCADETLAVYRAAMGA
ncbi:MAG: glycosyltransferase family 1 protein [Candidatus Hydrogenedentales bacterium]